MKLRQKFHHVVYRRFNGTMFLGKNLNRGEIIIETDNVYTTRSSPFVG